MNDNVEGYYLGLAKWVSAGKAAEMKGIAVSTLQKRRQRGTYVQGIHYRYTEGVGYEWCLKAIDEGRS